MPASTGASVSAILRYQSGTKNCYLISLSGAVGANLTLAVYTIVGGAVGSTLISTRATNISAPLASGLRVRIVAEAIGTSPTTLKIRVYNEATGAILENSSLTDSTASLQATGSSGICCWALSVAQSFEEFISSSAVATAPFNVVFEGDSITRSDQASSGIGTCFGTTYPAVTMNGLGLEWTGVNLGVSGQTASNMDSQATTRANTNKVATATNIMVLMCGTNDMGTGGVTPATVWASIHSIASKWRARGYKVVICTLLPAANAAYASTFNANRTALNTLIRNGWTVIADGLCDIGNHWLMAQNGSESRRQVFATDRTHPNDEGNQVLGLMVADAIKRILF
jgi:lysophospholipase L1-like esterase